MFQILLNCKFRSIWSRKLPRGLVFCSILSSNLQPSHLFLLLVSSFLHRPYDMHAGHPLIRLEEVVWVEVEGLCLQQLQGRNARLKSKPRIGSLYPRSIKIWKWVNSWIDIRKLQGQIILRSTWVIYWCQVQHKLAKHETRSNGLKC